MLTPKCKLFQNSLCGFDMMLHFESQCVLETHPHVLSEGFRLDTQIKRHSHSAPPVPTVAMVARRAKGVCKHCF